jgi:hypothetical protein
VKWTPLIGQLAQIDMRYLEEGQWREWDRDAIRTGAESGGGLFASDERSDQPPQTAVAGSRPAVRIQARRWRRKETNSKLQDLIFLPFGKHRARKQTR